MPPKSKAQARFMRAVASGSIKRKGLSRKEASEYVSGHPMEDLPEKTMKHSKHKKKKKKKVNIFEKVK